MTGLPSPSRRRPARFGLPPGWRERLGQWITTGIDPDDARDIEVSDADRARFRLQNLRACRSAIRWLAWLHLAALIGFWPTDRRLLGMVPGAVEHTAFGRALGVVFAVLVLYSLRLPDRLIEWVAWVGGIGTVAIISYTVGYNGGPSTLWFHTLDTFLMMGLVLWQRPLQRVASTAVIALVALAFFLLPNPSYFRDPMLGTALAFFVYTLVVSVFMGFYADRIRARMFLLDLELSRRRESLVRTVSAQTARIEALGQHLTTVRDEERTHLAHELHDEMGQVLTGMRVMVRVAQSRAGAEVRHEFEELGKLLGYATATLRDLLVRLRPPILDELGLPAAAEWLVRHSGLLAGVPCELAIRDREALDGLSPDASLMAFRFMQEALTNVVRHAQARRVEVSLGMRGDVAAISVTDDGAGFDPGEAARAPGHLGLAGMRERAARVGAELTVQSAPGRGTTLALLVPRAATRLEAR